MSNKLNALQCPNCHTITTTEVDADGLHDEQYCTSCGDVLEEVGYVAVLRHTPRIEDALTDSPCCATQVGVLLWQDGSPFLQECLACGAIIRAWRDSAGDVQTEYPAPRIRFTVGSNAVQEDTHE